MAGTLRSTVRHALNNTFCKIVGTAELAQDITAHAGLRAELEVIIKLAEEGGRLLASVDSDDPVPGGAPCSG